MPSAVSRLERFDAAVDAAFDRLRGRTGPDRLLYAASALGDHSLVWLLLAVLRALRPDPGLRAALRLAGGLAVESAVVNGAVKSVVRRRRPAWEGNRPRPLRQPRTSSFPSGHASSAACALVLLGEGDPLWPLYLAVAVVVTMSRVHVRIHHPSDMLAGLGLGLLLGLAVRRAVPLRPAAGSAAACSAQCRSSSAWG